MVIASVRLLTLCLLLLTSIGTAQAAPRPELWERWTAHDPQSMRRIDHRAWEKFLMRYVRIGADGSRRVAYGEVGPDGRAALEGYIDQLAEVPIGRYNRAEQMAYWINLYNALLLRVVLDHYPIASVRGLGGRTGLWSGAPWTSPQVEVEGVPVSLNDIEHRILRPIWHDPRLHYALSCAALGCPGLQPEPFTGERLERQLNEAAMAYVNDPGCIRIADHTLEVSSLFRWYQEDFGGSERAVINHLMAYAEPELAMRLQKFDRITADTFDWHLNDAAP
jgi:Protein of unknown function, DUF547